MTEALSDEEIQRVIAGYTGLQEELGERITAVRRELEQFGTGRLSGSRREGLRDGPTVPAEPTVPVGPTMSEAPVLYRPGDPEDRRRREQAAMIRKLTVCLHELEEEYRRNWCIHFCYESLPEREYAIVNRLYEKQIPWRAMQAETHLTLSTIRTLRRKALDTIRDTVRTCEIGRD